MKKRMWAFAAVGNADVYGKEGVRPPRGGEGGGVSGSDILTLARG
jgi:hypothetical protein